MIKFFRDFPDRTKKLKPNSGAMAVEFALVAPLFFLLLFATIELGIYLYDRQVLASAAREATRYGIIMHSPRYSSTQIEQRVLDAAANKLISAKLDCTPGENCSPIIINVSTPEGTIPGRPLTVVINTPFNLPLLSSFVSYFGDSSFPTSIPVGGSSTMYLE